ncbi:glycosyltransferase [Sinirhodobacter huangdaonensis]|uniref:Glycosyltransferase n=1 Tax=Paenirhodobacter huangdaonensis TaxID=2501515 RepID=A0A443LET0_9RHOB|nr:glycosyltransferase [Sinirhodobacter huangdaonensis]RWR47712.1 glycosyltransferase [Sinirhodobacter huangdaonensis]
MKILHICETATGGVASYLNMLGGIEDGVENVFLVPSCHADAMAPGLRLRLFPSTGRNPRSLFSFLRAAQQTIRDETPDIFFFHSTFALLGLGAMRLSAARRKKAIYCPHGWAYARYPAASSKARLVKSIEGRLCGLADVVINISQSDLTLAQRLEYRGDQRLVENAVIERRASARDDLFASEPEALHLLFVGRHDQQKGLDLLFEAFGEASQQRTNLRLHVLGKTVRRDGTPIPLPQNTFAAGWIGPAEIDDWYSSADAIVVPSRWEGFGLVVPEAFRNGTPALVSDRGALPDLIREGVTGHVFALGDESLLHRLRELDRSDLRAMRPACRATYDARFSVTRFVREILNIYRSLGSVGGGGRL